MQKALIIDDERLARNELKKLLLESPEIEVVGEAANAAEGLDKIENLSPDLVFLDIQMPQLTGIDFLKTLSDPPLVIFTTAYSNYAIEGFELNATDYLLKPISLERFMKAANKAGDQIELKRKEGASHVEIGESDEFIFVKADKKFVKINFSEVLYIEGLKDYVVIRTEKGRVITLQTMKSLEDKLPSKIFRRIHRSYIVNIGKVEAIVGNMVEVMEKGRYSSLPSLRVRWSS